MHPKDFQKSFNWIWSLEVPNKIKHFMWLLNHNRLPCNHTLHRMGVPVGPFFKYCANQNEDIPHIFWLCPQSSALWNRVFQKLNCPIPLIANLNSDNFLQIVQSWSHNLMVDHHINLQVLTVFYLREIWRYRNKNVFNNTNSYPSFQNGYTNATEYIFLAPVSSNPTQNFLISVHWNPPPPGTYKRSLIR